MCDFVSIVDQLYEHYGKWDAVADACGKHAGSYYAQVSSGRIKNLKLGTKRAIARAANTLGISQSCLDSFLSPPKRRGLAINTCLWNRLSSLRESKNWTWDELLTELLNFYTER